MTFYFETLSISAFILDAITEHLKEDAIVNCIIVTCEIENCCVKFYIKDKVSVIKIAYIRILLKSVSHKVFIKES